MIMKIAILAWGSLVWDPRELALAESSEWKTDGPALQIEFSRISRDGRLTLVIDETNGTLVKVLYAESKLEELDEVRMNLAKREGCELKRIGFCELAGKDESTVVDKRNPETAYTIREWCERMKFDAVVWTALGRRFKDAPETGGVDYSTDAALKYLEQLGGDMRRAAIEYIEKAPPQIDTAFRREFQKRKVEFEREATRGGGEN
jgi:hypothetical protein